jgi:hypothetical protein
MTYTSRYQVKDIPSLRHGLNDAMEASEIQDTEMADCENFSCDETSMVTAPGIVPGDYVPAPGPYWGMFHFVKSNGDSVFIRQRQGKLEYNTSQSTFYYVGWTECTLPQTGSPAENITLTEKTPCFAALNNTIVFTNGVDSVMSSTDGITWTIPTTGSPAEELPKTEYLINNGYNRLVFARTASDPSIIYWSDINAPTTIQDESWQYIDPNNGEPIVGIGKSPSGALLVFKMLSFYTIDDISLGMTAVNYIGAFKLANHHTIQTTEDSVICGGVDGIYELQSGVMRLISGRIKMGGRNLTLHSEAFRAGYYKREYHFAMPTNDTQSYNAQEYVIYKDLARQDPVQPYVITRNQRYIGAYCHVNDDDSVLGRPGGLFVADSRPAFGSPAEGGYLFGWINSYRQANYTQGIMGEAQPAYFTTKYFTEDAAFFVKRFKKLFAMLKVENDTTLTLAYRFLPYGSWIEEQHTVETDELEFIFGDGSTGTFSEGYGFFIQDTSEVFTDMEQQNEPRGVQFKISTNQINDVRVLSMAYKFLVRPQFH